MWYHGLVMQFSDDDEKQLSDGFFGYLAIWLRVTNMPEWGIPEKSIKNVAQRR